MRPAFSNLLLVVLHVVEVLRRTLIAQQRVAALVRRDQPKILARVEHGCIVTQPVEERVWVAARLGREEFREKLSELWVAPLMGSEPGRRGRSQRAHSSTLVRGRQAFPVVGKRFRGRQAFPFVGPASKVATPNKLWRGHFACQTHTAPHP